MASVFLSYDRDDTDRARHFARALEKAGHEVWWDLHVRGGAQFSKVIEEALAAADVIVVLWSANAIESPWVRDEAAAGRDSNRLVPVTIDGTLPPLGFRQFQTIDLSGWKGRGSPAVIRTFLSDVDATAGRMSAGTRASVSKTRVELPWRAVGTVAVLLVLIGAGFWFWRASSGRDAQVVAVAAADPNSRELAEAMLVNLAALPSAESGSVTLVGDEASGKKSDLIFRAAASKDASGTLSLLDGHDGSILWSKQFERSSANLAQRQSFAAGKVLDCAVEALTGASLNERLLKIYLNACASMAEIGWNKASVIDGMRQVTAGAPKFSGAWAKLLTAEAGSDRAADPGDAAFRNQLVSDINAARKADGQLAEATMAEAVMRPMPPIAPAIELIDKAKAQKPSSEAILTQRSGFMQMVGRFREALEDARRVTELDPMSAEARSNYILILAYAGQLDMARRKLAEAKRIWPEANTIVETEQSIEMRFGDFERAIRSGAIGRGPGAEDYVAMRRNPSNEAVERFYARAKRIEMSADQLGFGLQAFSEVGRPDTAYELLDRVGWSKFPTQGAYILFRPTMASFRANPRFMAFAKSLGLVDYWQNSGLWPDFCEDPRLPYDCRKEAAKLA